MDETKPVNQKAWNLQTTDSLHAAESVETRQLKYQDLTAFRLPSSFRGRSAVVVQLWWIVQDTLFRWSPQALFGWRNFLLRLFGAQLGSNVRIRPSARVTYPWRLTIGSNVWVGDDCVFYNLAQITLESHVALAHDVYLCTGLHDYSRLDFPISAAPITICDEAWVANDVFVGPDVTLGRGVVIGVRSTVLHDMPEGMVCYGSPARPVKPRLHPDDGALEPAFSFPPRR